MKKVTPCKDCVKRVPGCHGQCEEYATWRAEKEEAKNRERAERVKDYDYNSYQVARREKVRRKERL